MSTSDTGPRYRHRADAAIAGLLTSAGVVPPMTPRRLAGSTPDTDVTVTAPASPLQALQAAIGLLREVRGRIRDYACYAREDGHSWGEIGAALDRAADPEKGITAADAAFEYVASDLGHGPVFPWTCPACRGAVLDYGPLAGHPEDAEPGHAPGCERFAETVRAYEASWDEDAGGSGE